MAITVLLVVFVYSTAHTASSLESANEGATSNAVSIDDLLAIRDIRHIAVSPDGEYIAYQVIQGNHVSNSFSVSWHLKQVQSRGDSVIVDQSDEAAPSIDLNGRVIGDVLSPTEIVWSTDSMWIYFTKREAGAIQLWRTNRYGIEPKQLTWNDADVEGLKHSSGGSKLYFAVGRKRAEIEQVNEQEANLGHLVQVPPTYKIEYGPLWPACSDGTARWRHGINERRKCKLSVWVFDAPSDEVRPATAKETEDYFRNDDESFSSRLRRGQLKGSNRLMFASVRDGTRGAWFENVAPELFQGSLPPMRVAAFDGTETMQCTFTECQSTRPEGLWWWGDGKEVVFVVRDGVRQTLSSVYAWDPFEDTLRQIRSSDDLLYNCEFAEDRLICGHESWTSPRSIVAIHVVDGELETIVDENPDFRSFSFTKIEKITGEDAYGNPSHGHLVYPAQYIKGKHYPLVIVQYRSGGFLRGGTGDEVPIHVLSQRGFAVLSFDSSEGDYYSKSGDMLENQIKYLRYVMVEHGPATAVERMVDSLVERGIIDPGRVGISGLSHGAITVDTAILRRDYAAASVAYSYISPPSLFYSSKSYWGQALDGTFGGSPYSETGYKKRSKYSVGMNADGISTPLLIQVADREYFLTLQNYNALHGAGKPVEMWIFPDEYHVKWQPIHRYNVYRRNLQWFEFWLQGKEVADPVDAEQYARWRKMRAEHCSTLKVDRQRELPSYCEAG